MCERRVRVNGEIMIEGAQKPISSHAPREFGSIKNWYNPLERQMLIHSIWRIIRGSGKRSWESVPISQSKAERLKSPTIIRFDAGWRLKR